jgi:hypothetical protein
MKEGISFYNENDNDTNASMNLMMIRIFPDYIREWLRNHDLGGNDGSYDSFVQNISISPSVFGQY